MSSAKWRPFGLGLTVLNQSFQQWFMPAMISAILIAPTTNIEENNKDTHHWSFV